MSKTSKSMTFSNVAENKTLQKVAQHFKPTCHLCWCLKRTLQEFVQQAGQFDVSNH